MGLMEPMVKDFGKDLEKGDSSPDHGEVPAGTAAQEAEEEVFPPPCPHPVHPKIVQSREEGAQATKADQAMTAIPAMTANSAMTANPLDMCKVGPFRGGPHRAPFDNLRACMAWWKRHAPPSVLHLLEEGVEPQFKGFPRSATRQKKSPEEIEQVLKILEEYMEEKVVREIGPEGTQFLVPWFVIEKDEPGGGGNFA